ncbi:tRNA (guanine(46)-N(7))-methyltransferase TrmB [Herbaspirillum chlorophenolicum]|uniref:tRNA (guanine(46)-N(7))-methyltransferase TrmB n=1 Tax=Herbaspirillum chlorophenolicum TaxID=211589 RepID=UPI00067C4E4D|nr:SAM-dependent methyltransferase [Herbaspirillum chlorophenolicum]
MNSSPISSAQTGVHEQLADLVTRHASHPFRKPVTDYNRRAFDHSMAAWRAAGEPPLILDTGCGVGLSTLNLAVQYPDHFVIGIDQSADRLARNTHWEGPEPGNLCFVRADLVDYWRLAMDAGWRPARHYLLYPNPWPKIGHLARRWHGHAVFPSILQLGGHIECRSNWRIYVEEFAAALNQLSGLDAAAEPYATDAPITPFERKYLASGHTLWRCRADLGMDGLSKARAASA